MVTLQYCTRQMTTADTFFRSFPSDKMFAVNSFVAAPNGTVSASAQNHSTRGATYELAERPQVAAGWQRRLQAGRETAALRTAESALTTAVIPEIAGSHSLLICTLIMRQNQ